MPSSMTKHPSRVAQDGVTNLGDPRTSLLQNLINRSYSTRLFSRDMISTNSEAIGSNFDIPDDDEPTSSSSKTPTSIFSTRNQSGTPGPESISIVAIVIAALCLSVGFVFVLVSWIRIRRQRPVKVTQGVARPLSIASYGRSLDFSHNWSCKQSSTTAGDRTHLSDPHLSPIPIVLRRKDSSSLHYPHQALRYAQPEFEDDSYFPSVPRRVMEKSGHVPVNPHQVLGCFSHQIGFNQNAVCRGNPSHPWSSDLNPSSPRRPRTEFTLSEPRYSRPCLQPTPELPEHHETRGPRLVKYQRQENHLPRSPSIRQHDHIHPPGSEPKTSVVGQVIKPESLARESYPHPNLASSGVRVSAISTISRNSWMMKRPVSLKLKEMPSNSSLNSFNKPLAVRKLKSSFGVGREGDRSKDDHTQLIEEVEEGEKLDSVDSRDRSDPIFHHRTLNDRHIVRASSLPRSLPHARLYPSSEGDGRGVAQKDYIPEDEPEGQASSRKRRTHHFEKSKVEVINPLPFSTSCVALLGNHNHQINPQHSSHPSPVIEKPPSKLNSLLGLGTKLGTLTHNLPPVSRPDIDKHQPLNPKSFHQSLNWGRRHKELNGHWKRVNSVSSHGRVHLSNSISTSNPHQTKTNLPTLNEIEKSKRLHESRSFYKEQRRYHRHQHSKSVPDQNFLSQLPLEEEMGFGSDLKLNVMNPDQSSTSCEPSQSLKGTTDLRELDLDDEPCKLTLHTQLLDKPDPSPGDNASMDSLISSSCMTPTTAQKPSSQAFQRGLSTLLNGFGSHLDLQPQTLHPSPCSQIENRVQESKLDSRNSDPILSDIHQHQSIKLSESFPNSQSSPTHSLKSKLVKKVDTQSPLAHKASLSHQRINSESLGKMKSNELKVSQTGLHPIYNLPLSPYISVTRDSGSHSSIKRSDDLVAEEDQDPRYLTDPPIWNHQPSDGSNLISSQTPSPSKSSPLQISSPISLSPHQESNHARFRDQERSHSRISRLDLHPSGLTLSKTLRHLSEGGLSTTSSSDHLSSFGTGAASVNSEPQWKSRLNSVGSFLTNQSLDEHTRLWVSEHVPFLPSFPSSFFFSSLGYYLSSSPYRITSPTWFDH